MRTNNLELITHSRQKKYAIKMNTYDRNTQNTVKRPKVHP